MDAAVQQQPEPFELEYRFCPTPNWENRLDQALSLIVRLILSDYDKHPDDDGPEDNPERVP
jgi:hypothetical protein